MTLEWASVLTQQRPYQVLGPPKKPKCGCCWARRTGCWLGWLGCARAILRFFGAGGSNFLASAGTNWAKVSRTRACAEASGAGAGRATAATTVGAGGTMVGRLVS